MNDANTSHVLQACYQHTNKQFKNIMRKFGDAFVSVVQGPDGSSLRVPGSKSLYRGIGEVWNRHSRNAEPERPGEHLSPSN